MVALPLAGPGVETTYAAPKRGKPERALIVHQDRPDIVARQAIGRLAIGTPSPAAWIELAHPGSCPKPQHAARVLRHGPHILIDQPALLAISAPSA
jgi:hypothetical protein